MKKFFLKKFIPVYQSKDKICIGYARKDKYFELDHNEDNLYLLNQVIKEGISKTDFKNQVFNNLFKLGFLEVKSKPSSIHNINREGLYLQYLDNKNFNGSVKKTRILIFGAGAVIFPKNSYDY